MVYNKQEMGRALMMRTPTKEDPQFMETAVDIMDGRAVFNTVHGHRILYEDYILGPY